MRFSFLLITLFITPARANPVVAASAEQLIAFISSEKLTVTIGAAEANFNGTFTFKSNGDVSKIEPTAELDALQIPIWFPADAKQSTAIASFWKVVEPYPYSIDPKSAPAVEQAVALKVVVGEQPLQARDLLISDRGGDGYIPKRWREPGYHVLLFTFMVPFRYIASGAPITISYRQPLFNAAGSSSFFYLPIFEQLPKSVSLSDTNRYCITLTAAANCDLAVTNGLFQTRVEPGRDVNLVPEHLQAIRVTVQSRANNKLQPTATAP
jgi:hypothetical protein